jgi:hypothetical protein
MEERLYTVVFQKHRNLESADTSETAGRATNPHILLTKKPSSNLFNHLLRNHLFLSFLYGNYTLVIGKSQAEYLENF